MQLHSAGLSICHFCGGGVQGAHVAGGGAVITLLALTIVVGEGGAKPERNIIGEEGRCGAIDILTY
ncbi:hypothetical protein EON65_17690 [archaeon]|nr:MAG: hypothetical protein EON65_17690 [archaeon]